MATEPPKKLIRADEAQVLLLDKMLMEIREVARQTRETADILSKQPMPEGIIEPLHTVHVTTENVVITPPYRIPWWSVSVVNDGPDDCNVIVNTEKSSTTPYPLREHETFEVDLGAPKIVDLLLYCDVGSADLRIRGVR